ncbi:MAG TPA: YlcI/YnfO family protein [Ramlibacter sp.]|nr:YlcI/YnfO family protein [Ramlibacter sp.]
MSLSKGGRRLRRAVRVSLKRIEPCPDYQGARKRDCAFDVMHLQYNEPMKSTQLPPVRVAPAVRQEIEDCLEEGETLSQFIEKAAVEAARARIAEQAFLERGRASLERALRTGKLYPAADVLAEMRERLSIKMREAKKNSRKKT